MPGAEDLKLIGGWASPYSMRPRIALNLKGIAYEFFVETFVPDKSELLLKSNPVYKKIPVLIHNGKPVCESLVILNYIDDAWASTGPAILPSDPYDRAIARFWAVYIDDKWFPAVSKVGMAATEEAKAEALEEVFAGTQLLEEAFKKSSKGKGFFNGDTIGYLDIALGSFLGWVKAMSVMAGVKYLDEEKTPLIVGWAERFCADEAVKEVMPATEKLVEFAAAFAAK